MKKFEVWATAKEAEYLYTDLAELLEALDEEPEVGMVVYRGTALQPSPSSFCDIGDILERLESAAYDDGGEYAEDFLDVPKVAIDDLEGYIKRWLDQHCQVRWYDVKNPEPYVITQEDLDEFYS